MNIYNYIKLNRYIKSARIKSTGIWLLHILNKRYLAVHIDPVLACNLRCKMCYFSNEDKRKQMHGKFEASDLPLIANSIFKHALKLQIGCGAEPTVFKHNTQLIALGKKYEVPYISFTTNANLLTSDDISDFVAAGLNEITISLHGVQKETYEYLMVNAVYDKLIENLGHLSTVKSMYPNFKIRINYTVNERNLDELTSFFDVFGKFEVDILQIRPIQNMEGEIAEIVNERAFIESFNTIIKKISIECKNRGITLIAPQQLSLEKAANTSSSIFDATYCYISPKFFWRNNYEWRTESFKQFSHRTGYGLQLFKNIFRKNNLMDTKLNYDIK